MRTLPRLLRLMVLCTSVSIFGCHALYAEGAGMHEVPTASRIEADPDSALIVFVRPSFFGFALVPMIVDEQGRFVGQSTAESYFVAKVAPGRHTFTAFWEEQGALRAHVEKGRIYVVEVSIVFRVNTSATGRPELRPVPAGSVRFTALTAKLPTMHRYAPDAAAGDALIVEGKAEIERRIRESERTLADFDAEDLASYTLRPSDGL